MIFTLVLLGQGICHLPVLITVQHTVGDVQVICCHLVNAMGNADQGGGGTASMGSQD